MVFAAKSKPRADVTINVATASISRSFRSDDNHPFACCTVKHFLLLPVYLATSLLVAFASLAVAYSVCGLGGGRATPNTWVLAGMVTVATWAFYACKARSERFVVSGWPPAAVRAIVLVLAFVAGCGVGAAEVGWRVYAAFFVLVYLGQLWIDRVDSIWGGVCVTGR
jgi:hypothetical protein